MSRNYGGTMVANLFVKFGADTEEYQKKMRAAVTRMLFAAESLTQAGRILSTAVTAPMIAIGVASLKTAMEFEAAMTKMEALVGIPADTIARWKPVVQEMAGTVGKSAKELADALFFITSNGIQSDQALKVLEATAKASAIGLGETKDIAIAATSALNAFGEGAMTADESVAVLIGTVREGNLEAAELPAALSKLLPIAAALDVEFHEAGAGIAAMSRAGTSARLAAFGLRAIMLGLQAPTYRAAEAFERAELSAEQLRLEMKTNLWGAITRVTNAVGTNGVTLREMIPNIKAYAAMLQLTGKTAEANEKIFKNMSEVVGEDVDKAFNIGSQTMERKYTKALGNLSAAAIDVGNQMEPLVDNFLNLTRTIRSATSTYADSSDTVKGLGTSLAFVALTTGPLLYGLGSLARIMARFTGLSILLKLAWVQNAAGMMENVKASTQLGASMTRLGVSWKKAAGGMVLAFGVGWQVGKWLDKQIGITKFLNEELGHLGSSVDSVGEAFEENAEKMWDYTNANHALAMKIGEVDLAHQIAAARAAGNMREVSRLTAEVEKKANAYNAARIKVEGLTKAEEDELKAAQAITDAMEEQRIKEEERLKRLREGRDIMTSQEVIDKMGDITTEYHNHIDAGVSRNRVNKEMVEDTKEVVEWLREYGLAASQSFKDMVASMNETGNIENSEFYKMFNWYIPQAIDAMPGKVLTAMVEINGMVAENLQGGFGKGFEDGISEFDKHDERLQELLNLAWRGGFEGMGDAIREEVEQILDQEYYANVKPDPDVFNDAMHDLIDGNIPDTRG